MMLAYSAVAGSFLTFLDWRFLVAGLMVGLTIARTLEP